ncbi:MAG: hypothetical protein WDZ59_07340 [Pirellulales bacterium]
METLHSTNEAKPPAPATRRLARLAGCILLVLLSLEAAALLAASAYPGVLADQFSMTTPWLALHAFSIGPYATFAVLGLVATGTVAVAVRWIAHNRDREIASLSWRAILPPCVVVAATLVLLAANVPRRIAFAVARPAFTGFLEALPGDAPARMELNRRLGIYQVDEVTIDPRGGVFFRTYSGADGIGPDVMSHGFCYRPNPDGTPFGAASYRRSPLGDGWYWFQASDDWF